MCLHLAYRPQFSFIISDKRNHTLSLTGNLFIYNIITYLFVVMIALHGLAYDYYLMDGNLRFLPIGHCDRILSVTNSKIMHSLASWIVQAKISYLKIAFKNSLWGYLLVHFKGYPL